MFLNLLALSSALASQPLGYPIFIRNTERKCEFVIQDMIMTREKDVREWMEELPDKGRQIDLLWSHKPDIGCLRKVQKIIRRIGFINVVTIQESGNTDYPSGLPPE